MIELRNNKLIVSFPESPLKPWLAIDLQRTLRIPDDGRTYPLPPGLGSFPLRHIDDFADKVPKSWLKRGGVLLPMWQSEALWLHFRSASYADRGTAYPFAMKIATGKINAITGEPWAAGLSRNPQSYLVTPGQPWLDGYCVEKGVVRQFVAMPMGQGYSTEEQLTGSADVGGIQIEVFPMRWQAFYERFPVLPPPNSIAQCLECAEDTRAISKQEAMGLAPGGRMRQEVFRDPYSIHDWDERQSSRCFIHLVNSATWKRITGEAPPTQPLTPRQYSSAGYPWFDYYNPELEALKGSATLAGVKSVTEKDALEGAPPLQDNETVSFNKVVTAKVREGDFS